MAFTGGVFTPSAIGAAILKEKEIMTSRHMAELSKEIIAGQAILSHQDHVISNLGAGAATLNASIVTLRTDSTDVGSKTPACSITGSTPEPGSEAATLTKEALVNFEQFYIDETIFANAYSFMDLYAYMSAKAKVNLEGKLSQALVTLANTNLDTPSADWFETPGTVNSTVYEVATADFKSDLLADLQWAGKYSGMRDPIIINGRNFFNSAILEQYASAGCCTNDAILNRNQVFQIYWDALNVDSVTSAKSSFVIDKNSLIFISSPGYTNIGMETMLTQGQEADDTYHFVDILPRLRYFANGSLQPIYVDVRVKKVCTTDAAGIPRNGWKFIYMLFGAMRANLPDANGRYGILRVDQIAGA